MSIVFLLKYKVVCNVFHKRGGCFYFEQKKNRSQSNGPDSFYNYRLSRISPRLYRLSKAYRH